VVTSTFPESGSIDTTATDDPAAVKPVMAKAIRRRWSRFVQFMTISSISAQERRSAQSR
jgi:hypothetical protein